MIRVGFWYDRPQEYSGGLNYIRNLLLAIAASNHGEIEPFLFFGSDVSADIVAQFDGLATVVRTSLLRRRGLPWYLSRLLFKSCGSMRLVEWVVSRHRVAVLSHAEHVYGRELSFAVISWIPDFQYLYLPDLFPGSDTALATRRLRRIVAGSHAVVLSSHAARRDFERVMDRDLWARAQVLQFVSQPRVAAADGDRPTSLAELEHKYGFSGRFFYLPNQFWRHKNHALVLEAVRRLKQRGKDVLVLCTGNLVDYRYGNSEYVEELRHFIAAHSLHENVRILGMVDYRDVLALMRNCVAVLNPSRHEGWSSAVEEAKALGRRVVASRIPVHLEQDAPGAEYFAVDDGEQLAEILQRLWQAGPQSSQVVSPTEAAAALRVRTLGYGRAYIELVGKVAGLSRERKTR